MEREPRPVRARRRGLLALVATLTLALAAFAGPFAGPVAAEPTPPGASHAAAPARTATVMTRNLYLGAGLTNLVDALETGDPTLIVGAATQTWQQVVDSDPAERMEAVADEIAKAKPHAVGLQEVTKFTLFDYDPQTQSLSNPTVPYDLLRLLKKALAERGAPYRVVKGATADNFTSDPIPILAGAAFPTKAVQLLDRDVIMVRKNVRARNARNGNFDTVLAPPAAPLTIDRGWGSADLRTRLARFRFVNTHLEAFGPEELRIAQVLELFAAQADITAQSGALPTVYAGDFNTPAPTGGAYQVLLAGGLTDLWTATPPARRPAEGDTCCQLADLSNMVSLLDERIDLLLGTPGVRPIRADRVGDEPVDLPGDTWWASDHAGVVADVVIRRR